MNKQINVNPNDEVRFRIVVPLPDRQRRRATPEQGPVLDLVVPVHNQEGDIARCIRRLCAFLLEELPFSARITIADCASTDATREIAHDLARELRGIRVIHLNEASRGRALAAAWMTSGARVVACIDDSALTDLSVLPALVAPLILGHTEITIGGRQSVRARSGRCEGRPPEGSRLRLLDLRLPQLK